MEMQSSNPEYMRFKAGALVMFEHGEYSDFGTLGLYRVVKDVDLQEMARRFRAVQVDPDDTYVDCGGFPPFLESEGYLESVDHRAVHLGSYNEFELS